MVWLTGSDISVHYISQHYLAINEHINRKAVLFQSVMAAFVRDNETDSVYDDYRNMDIYENVERRVKETDNEYLALENVNQQEQNSGMINPTKQIKGDTCFYAFPLNREVNSEVQISFDVDVHWTFELDLDVQIKHNRRHIVTSEKLSLKNPDARFLRIGPTYYHSLALQPLQDILVVVLGIKFLICYLVFVRYI